MKLNEFNYDLPKELIAQEPAEPRDSCRLLVLDKVSGEWSHQHFRDILSEIHEGDVFVFNNTKVIPARLYGKKKDTGGKIEVLLLTPKGNDVWEILVNPGRKALQFHSKKANMHRSPSHEKPRVLFLLLPSVRR